MTRKERIASVLRHQPVDRLPTQINYTSGMGEKLASYFGIDTDSLQDLLGNHLLRVDISFRKPANEGPIQYDWWGAGFDTHEEGYLISRHPLVEQDDLAAFPWPDAMEASLMDEASDIISNDMERHFIIPNMGFALFERAWALRGLEQFLTDLVMEPLFAEELLERITVIQTVLAQRFVEAGVDGGYFGDDLGAQRGLLFSPDLWRRQFKPRLARMFAVFRDAGLPVILHSDGDITPIIPDLIDIGLSALNPCQPEIFDHTWLKREYGKDLAFYGGLSTQRTLPNGTPEDVVSASRKCIEALASDRTGLIFGPSHRIMTDIPPENIEALISTFQDLLME